MALQQFYRKFESNYLRYHGLWERYHALGEDWMSKILSSVPHRASIAVVLNVAFIHRTFVKGIINQNTSDFMIKLAQYLTIHSKFEYLFLRIQILEQCRIFVVRVRVLRDTLHLYGTRRLHRPVYFGFLQPNFPFCVLAEARPESCQVTDGDVITGILCWELELFLKEMELYQINSIDKGL